MSATSSVPALVAEGLGKRYGRVWGLRDCSLTVPVGRVVGLVGANGAGKTTLLNYWSFQLIESAIFAALTILLVAFAVRWVRHRIVSRWSTSNW